MFFKPVINPDKSVYAVLDISELDINTNGNITKFLTFPVHTYNKLSKVKNYPDPINSPAWQYVFGYVNHFMDTLSVTEKEYVAKTYAVIRKDIDNYQEAGDIFKINELVKLISSRLLEMDMATQFCDKLAVFVKAVIPIGLLKDAGSRPQDRPELTFYKDEVEVVTAITLLCKCLCPIFGTIIAVTKKHIQTSLKELHCSCIMTDLINVHYKNETEKLKYFVEHVTKQIYKEDDSSELVYGYDMNSLAYQLYCQLLVRQLVNVNLAVRDSNLMSYIIVSIKHAAGSVKTNVSNTPTKGRTPIAVESDDEGNIAQLETDSMTSKKTADIDSLISAAVIPTITKFKAQFDIEDCEYDECTKYYATSALVPSPINEQLNSLLYGQDFGGSIGIKMLKFNAYSLITILTQMIIFQHDADPAYKTLAHLITAKPSIATTLVNDELSDNIINIQVSASTPYKNCRQRFISSTLSAKNKEWENHIQYIIHDIAAKHYVYNTAPFLWDFLGDENLNGKIIQIDKGVMIAYCAFCDWIMQLREASAIYN